MGFFLDEDLCESRGEKRFSIQKVCLDTVEVIKISIKNLVTW